MNKLNLISAVALSAGTLMSSQAVLAYEAGDIFVRAGVAQTDTGSGNGNAAGLPLNVQSARGITFGAGYLFTDQVGVELNSSEKFEHDLSLGGAGGIGSVDRMPVNVLVNYYPMGGLDSKVQPYVGLGLNYTRFSGESTTPDVSVDNSYGVIGQAGVDLAITYNIMLNGYVSYADVNADINAGGAKIGEVDIEPVTVGGGVTYRF